MKKMQLSYKYINLMITVVLFFALFAAGSVLYNGFFSTQVLLNMLIDNAFLIITAIGMTFVLIIGGIDISVGSVIALVCMLSAYLLEMQHLSAMVVIPLMLLMGFLFGLVQGSFIHFFTIQPFIVTLAGMFLARGLCYVISIDTIMITNPFYLFVATYRIPLPFDNYISISVIIALVLVAAALYLSNYTRFGRAVYAIGGNAQSAMLMGLPVGRTKVLVYGLSGFCSALSGVVFSFYMLSGYGLHAMGLEMDAIASAVIGGTPLTGGVGFVTGTLFGVLIQGVIQTLIMFQGTLSSWWTKIAVAFLLCLFIVLQRIVVSKKERTKSIT
ncbi:MULTISPECIES: galactofuranose ABC transporter, permease protein YjfF [Pelosinus]|uniref:ABC-type transporter, integral membrane subunit n=1 Tax=Pelosinus fermentans B4 TaxID=1149862 RepID=I9LBV3_9FIRM|nr:ABC-type transporter, integral membrane subunit [Pelosinus fermentans B4]EIW23758.1 ABC-type transporter, integral membrane subunit [Pelosinus fermentans A11]OAM94681.1 ABC-type transporter, integral membrane subunit [Pelosinus fermentans DSM 17108]SDR15274.1 monosaccharide ABC transporter membrane protein, CUT2 family [Pelosinus fermentans]